MAHIIKKESYPMYQGTALSCKCTPYFFVDDNGIEYYIKSLHSETGHPDIDKSSRKDLARELLQLRLNNFKYVPFLDSPTNLLKHLEWIEEKTTDLLQIIYS